MDWTLVWDEIYRTQGEVQAEALPTLPLAMKLFQTAGLHTVLDLGCGTGRHTVQLAKAGFRTTACDISPEAVAQTTEKAAASACEVETIQADMRTLPFPDGAFDAVLCLWTTGHGTRADLQRHAQEMLRVTRPGGLIFADYVTTDDAHCGVGRAIEPNTFLDNMEGEEAIPHHYTTAEELRRCYAPHALRLSPFCYTYLDRAQREQRIETLLAVCQP